MLKKLSVAQTTEYLQQVSLLLDNGSTLPDALQQVQLFQTKKTARQTAEILSNIQKNVLLSESLKTYTTLEPFLINLLREAELKKELPNSLKQITSFREKLLYNDLTIFKKVRNVLFYPFIVGIIAFVLISGIMAYVVPVFQGIYSSFGGELPFLTQLVSDLSYFISNNLYIILFGLLVVTFVSLNAKRSKSAWFYKIMSHWWFTGKLYRQNVMVIFLRTAQLLSTLKRPSNEVFLAMNDLTDHYHAQLFKTFQETPLKAYFITYFSPYFSFLITECLLNTKITSQSFEELANKLTEQLQQQSEMVKQTIELLLLIIMGCVIGTIVISVYLPIFMIASLV